MVTQDQQDLRFSPERGVARLVLSRRSMVPPVDVVALAKEYAEIEYDFIPGNCDAVVLKRGAHTTKPLLILDQTKSATRLRFTVAHELGHLLVPWHIGTFACNPQADVSLDEHHYEAVEREANQFASELLMPRPWLRKLLSSSESVWDYLCDSKETADVSWDAALISAAPIVPPGHIFSVCDDDNRVMRAMKSEGTPGQVPSAGCRVSRDFLGVKPAAYRSKVIGHGRVLHWWDCSSCDASTLDADTRSSLEIFQELLQDVSVGEAERRKLGQRINGVLGYAHGKVRGKSEEEVLGLLNLAFAQRPALVAVTSHSLFARFLRTKAVELSARHR